MYARAAHATPSLSTIGAGWSLDGGMLDRLCDVLRLDGAFLTDADSRVVASGGQRVPGGLPTLAHARHSVPRIIETETCASASVQFAMVVPVTTTAGPQQMTLVLWGLQPRPAALGYRLLALATDLVAQATLERVRRYHEHNRIMFERASQTAHIGIWVCTLPEQVLYWTNGVYDLFELPRGATLQRDATVAHYTPESREQMQAMRAKAIAERSGFNMDAEIITAKGNRRWMRLTGAVECENDTPRRIFGMKQDITEEKLLADRTRYLAEFDVMTGLANRSQFQNRINDLDAQMAGGAITALLVVDIDGFKQINDTHGHAVGDDYLKEAARRLVACFAGADLVARIGGDEFAILLGATATGSVEKQAAAAVAALSGQAHVGGIALPMSVSIGVAHRHSAIGDDLFREADTALYAAKAAGRNTFRVFPH